MTLPLIREISHGNLLHKRGTYGSQWIPHILIMELYFKGAIRVWKHELNGSISTFMTGDLNLGISGFKN